jgi:hypothetical protein
MPSRVTRSTRSRCRWSVLIALAATFRVIRYAHAVNLPEGA